MIQLGPAWDKDDTMHPRLKEGRERLVKLVGREWFIMSELYGYDQIYTFMDKRRKFGLQILDSDHFRLEHIEHWSVFPSDELITKIALVAG